MADQIEVIGDVSLPSDGYHARLSDLVNNPHPFLNLTDVEVYQKGVITLQTPFVALNKQGILFLAEDDSTLLEDFSMIEIQRDSNF